MTDNKEYSAIDSAFGVRKSPVYVICRHGRRRRFLSRSSALNNLVHFMVQFVFDKQGISTHEGGYERQNDDTGCIEFSRGQLTERYWDAHHRTYRRLIRIMARKRQIQKWKDRHDALTHKYRELMQQKPF
ncbi:hypothetical protein RQD06_001427 [Klebsiella pneumoniae]|nr:hypothetical protein [Klebsiella pneumoniae]ELH2097910.1 hypothetical protein [Klebsiella pneumoniae]DAO12524.1 MAG TPA: hypothetical protein [Caudoviricetes sp.]HDH0344383.1 hypothetical protein [Klebsiella pneumoniae]